MTNENQSTENYKLALFDTNFISEVSKAKITSKDLKLENAHKIISRMYESGYLPVIAIQTIRELKRNEEVFNLFKEVFNDLPIGILKNWDVLHQLENPVNQDLILTVSTPINKFTKIFFEDQSLLKVLNSNKIDEDAEKYFLELWDDYENTGNSEVKILNLSLKNYSNNNGMDEYKIKKLPIYIFWKNQIFKLKNSKKAKALSDINDVMIVACASKFVNKIYTEKSQAEFIKQMKNQNLLDNDIEVFILNNGQVTQFL